MDRGPAHEVGGVQLGSSTPNCFAYSAFSRCQPPNFMASGPTMRPMRPIAEEPIHDVEADMPAGGAHRDESTVDVVPERESRAAGAERLELPANLLRAPIELEHLGRVGALHVRLGDERLRRSDGGELHGAHGAQVAVGVERSPLAQVLGVGQRLPDLGRRVREVADENERPLVAVLLDLGAERGTGCVLFTVAHFFFFPFKGGDLSIVSKCFSSASTCFDQKRRKGMSHSSSSMRGSGLNR